MAITKHAGGRPTKYDPQYSEDILEYFSVEPWREVPVVTTYKDGTTKEDSKMVANDLPTFEGFARKIAVHRETLLNWLESYPEFFDAYKRAKDIQKDLLITNGLQGLYSAPFAIFTAKNITDMKDKTETEVTNPDGSLNAYNPELAAKFTSFLKKETED